MIVYIVMCTCGVCCSVLQCIRNSTETHLVTAVFSCTVHTYCTLHLK